MTDINFVWLSGAAPEVIAVARAESHATRSAIEAPKVQVAILVPSLAAAAEEATRTALALRGARTGWRPTGIRRKGAVGRCDQL